MSTNLGIFELLVLMAVAAHGENAYGVVIRRAVAASRGSDVSSGGLYTTLDRLERRGLVRSRRGDPSEVRGASPRRYYRLTPGGAAAIRANYAAVRDLGGRAVHKLSKA
jgi:DNA-binding PadR family transcriptional regulator